MSTRLRLPALRQRDGHHARVTYEELFFDLVYVFAVTQLSHHLLHHLGLSGVLQTLVLWFAVWLGWQYACWVSNWFDPQAPRIRGLLFATMLLALLMSSSIPEAFADRAWVFAGAYAAMQVGRTAFVLLEVGGDHPLAPNFRRMLAWVSVSACFWLAGAAAKATRGWRCGRSQWPASTSRRCSVSRFRGWAARTPASGPLRVGTLPSAASCS